MGILKHRILLSSLLATGLLAGASIGHYGQAAAQYLTSPTTQQAVPNGPLSPSRSDVVDALTEERVEALELRIAQLEQMLDAQKVLRNRTQMTEIKDLRDRLSSLEARVQTGGAVSDMDQAPAIGGDRASPTSDMSGTNAADLQMRYNDMAESLRLLQSQTDRLMLQMRTLEKTMERTGADNEFRFQALESGVRRANTGISSTSDEEQVIGFVKRAAPVTELGSSQLAASAAAVAAPLVGEGDLSVLDNFGQANRTSLADPKELYERALGDLQAGNYAAAELDFAALLTAHPAHDLAGNAQYWLGETHYVRRQYKRAAQAFLSGYTTYATSAKAPDSLLKLGMTLTALGEKKTGCDAFAELNARFPDAKSAVRKRAEIERKRADCGS